LSVIAKTMGNEVATVAGGAATVVTGVAAGATLGQVPALNKAAERSVRYTARNAQNTRVWHVGEAATSAAGTAACAVAAGATLGQCRELNEATGRLAQNTGKACGQYANRFVEDLNPLSIPNNVSKAFFFEFTRNLPDKGIRCWLAECAMKCMKEHPSRVLRVNCGLEGMHAVVYHRNGKKCLAIRGSTALPTWFQDAGMVLSEGFLCQLVDIVVRWARSENVDYVTGHSLGGFLAEAVASRLGMDGASFNGPGGRGIATVFGNKWSTSTRFEVHLNELDPVSMFRNNRHIAEPKWHRFRGKCHPHAIEDMLDNVKR